MTKKNNHSKALKSLTFLTLLILFSFILISCNGNANVQEQNVVEDVVEEPVVEEVVVEEPVVVEIPDQSAFAEVPHNVYDLGHGPNTACSRCHSPQNWDPEAWRGPAPSCWTCKFDHEDELRVAANNPLVEEADWVGIPCESCHEVDMNGTASAETSWLNPISMARVEVNTPTELCEKCHITTTGNSRGSSIDHKRTLGGSAHLNHVGFIGDVAPPQYCTDCHDPHDNKTMPACDDCHDVRTLDTHIKGKNALHMNVSCMACHDGSGLDVGPSVVEELEGMWVTQLTEVGRSGPTTEDLVSHSPSYAVTCDKCHIADSPHGLTEYTAAGEIPMVDICVDGEDFSVEKPTLADYGVVDVDYTEGKCPEATAP